MLGGHSPTSSRKIAHRDRCAVRIMPSCVRSAPVKAPFRWPKNSESAVPSDIVASATTRGTVSENRMMARSR